MKKGRGKIMSNAKSQEEDKVLQIWDCYKKLNTDERKELGESIKQLSEIRHRYFSTYLARQKKFLSFEDVVETFLCSKKNFESETDYKNFPALPLEEIADVIDFVEINFSLPDCREKFEKNDSESYSRILQALTLRFSIRTILEKFDWQNLNRYFQLSKISRRIKKVAGLK